MYMMESKLLLFVNKQGKIINYFIETINRCTYYYYYIIGYYLPANLIIYI